MISLQISDTKQFMNILLGSESFDSFYLEEAIIKTYHTFTIDGHINKEFYSTEELGDETNPIGEFSLYRDNRPICFSLMKGTRTPVSFRIVLQASEQYRNKLLLQESVTADPSTVKSLLLNIKYDGTKVTCVTGTAFHTFIMDKSVDAVWDAAVRKSFDALNIAFEEL